MDNNLTKLSWLLRSAGVLLLAADGDFCRFSPLLPL